MKKVLIAPNSFKGCANSVEIADLLQNYIKELSGIQYPDSVTAPLSDGGDGFLEIFSHIENAQLLYADVPCDKGNAVTSLPYVKLFNSLMIESAKIIGLESEIPANNHPLKISSAGVGELIKSLKILYESNSGVDEIIIGVGGTGTVDMGIGMLSVFGLKLLDDKNNELPPLPEYFPFVNKIIAPNIKLPFRIKFVVDCNNPLTGEFGAARVYGPQKGLDVSGIKIIEKGFDNILKILGLSVENFSGAGGGLASLITSYYDVTLINSEKFISEYILKDIEISDFDLIITGEGKLDEQSFMEKAVGIIGNLAIRNNLPLAVVCGSSTIKVSNKNWYIIEISKYFDNFKDSLKHYKEGIKQASVEIVSILNTKI